MGMKRGDSRELQQAEDFFELHAGYAKGQKLVYSSLFLLILISDMFSFKFCFGNKAVNVRTGDEIRTLLHATYLRTVDLFVITENLQRLLRNYCLIAAYVEV